MRNLKLEKEMVKISKEIWPYLKGKEKKFPKILSKQGGGSGCYYREKHTVYYRWNVWHNMPLAGKRMLVIHELYHAKGNHHKSGEMFCHSFDILTIEIYKKIYGEDKEYKEVIEKLKEFI